jgi:hypothetical protein
MRQPRLALHGPRDRASPRSLEHPLLRLLLALALMACAVAAAAARSDDPQVESL